MFRNTLLHSGRQLRLISIVRIRNMQEETFHDTDFDGDLPTCIDFGRFFHLCKCPRSKSTDKMKKTKYSRLVINIPFQPWPYQSVSVRLTSPENEIARKSPLLSLHRLHLVSPHS
jgi:hypothetical protein